MRILLGIRSLRAILLLGPALTACVTPRGHRAIASPSIEEWDYVADDGVRQYVTEFGRGDTVVVLHGGWGGDHGGLAEAVRPLADRFHFVLYDQRGSLRSPAPENSISVARLVADLEGLRRQLGQERLTIFAHSMGAVLSYAYLATHPERVDRLVLAAAVLPSNDLFRSFHVPAGDTARLARQRRDLSGLQNARRNSTLAAAGLVRADTAGFTDRERAASWRIGLAARMLANPERWRELRGGPSFYNPRVGQAIDRSMPGAQHDSLWKSFLPALASFRGPVTVIVGDADFIDPEGALWTYAMRQLPNGRLVVIPRAGHSAWIDDPSRFTAALRGGLERIAVP